LPLYEGELELQRIALSRLNDLDADAVELMGILADGSLGQAHLFENRTWRRTSDALDESLRALVDLNMAHVRAYVVDAIRHAMRALVILAIASVLSVLSVGLALGWAGRVVRRHERELEGRAEEWELFSGRVAHDLLNPLQVASMAMALAKERCHDEQVVKVSVRGSAALARLRGTVDALLGFAKSGGHPSPEDTAPARPVVEGIVDEFRPSAEERGIDLHCDLVPEVQVRCAPGVLNVLLSNLLRNAIKYMGDRTVRRVEIKVSAGASDARFEVRDTGPGIDPGMERRIFQPLVRGPVTSEGGIGLGLATVKRIAEAHGGEVGVQSAKGSGSVFWFQLPRS
jgi:signal transduction histidine kinase